MDAHTRGSTGSLRDARSAFVRTSSHPRGKRINRAARARETCRYRVIWRWWGIQSGRNPCSGEMGSWEEGRTGHADPCSTRVRSLNDFFSFLLHTFILIVYICEEDCEAFSAHILIHRWLIKYAATCIRLSSSSACTYRCVFDWSVIRNITWLRAEFGFESSRVVRHLILDLLPARVRVWIHWCAFCALSMKIYHWHWITLRWRMPTYWQWGRCSILFSILQIPTPTPNLPQLVCERSKVLVTPAKSISELVRRSQNVRIKFFHNLKHSRAKC